MSKKVLKRIGFSTLAVVVLAALIVLFIYLFRTTPNGNIYLSKDDELKPEKIVQLINDAEAKNYAYPDIQYTYDFHVDCEIDGKNYRFGTENVVAFTGIGTADAKGHRINTYTSIKDGTKQQSESESFFYSNGKVYSKRFGKNYWSEMASENFLPYTEYSSISANADFLSAVFYENATVYELFKGVTEICFTGSSDYLTNGIITFIGLDKTDYKYEVSDVLLTVLIAKNGSLSEKRLTFNVEYYSEDDPDNVLTYKGDFSYTLNKTSNITVNERNKADNYAEISNINLLSSITETGYLILSNQSAFDVTYKKQITITDASGAGYFYDGALSVVAIKNGSALNYSSIRTERYTIEKDVHTSIGTFIDENGYTERSYDYIKNETTSSVDNRAHDYTADELMNIIMEAIAAERLFEDEIASVSTLSEDDTTVTYSVRFVRDANKYFAGYLAEFFAEDDDASFDVDNFGFTSNKCDIYITVRKSDGCIMKQIIDYSATLLGMSGMSGSITVEGIFEMTVNATGADVTLLDVNDFNAEVENNKNK